MKWIIRRFNSFFRTLVQITLVGTGTRSTEPYGGCLENKNLVGTYNTDVFIAHTHWRSLNNESLKTLLAKTEAISNSRHLKVNKLGDVQGEQPICPNNILTMKSKVVLPPPGHFMKADEYSRKRWRRIQHIANEFWVRWQKEFLWSLQPCHKWNEKHRNFQNGDIALLKKRC